VSFATAQGTNVSFVYIMDSYRPIAGEAVVTQLAFKCKCPHERGVDRAASRAFLLIPIEHLY